MKTHHSRALYWARQCYLVFVMALAAATVIVPLSVSGCKAVNQRPDVPLAPGGVHETSAEFDYKLAIVTNHTRLQEFINWEEANPAVAQRLPQVHQLAQTIANDLPAKFREANTLFAAYDSIPASSENADALAQARRNLNAALAVLVSYVKQANTAQLRASAP